jgi:hypothetical protein
VRSSVAVALAPLWLLHIGIGDVKHHPRIMYLIRPWRLCGRRGVTDRKVAKQFI